MIKLIALDLDGTLLDPRGRITEKTKQAIAKARESGVRVVLSTGRCGQEAAAFAREAGCDSLAVCLGGAALLDGAQVHQLQRWDMPWDSGRKALALCLNKGIELMIFAGEQIVLDPFSKQSQLVGYPYPVYHNAAVVAEDPMAYLDEHQLPVTKIHGDLNPAAYPLKEFAQLPGLEVTASNDHDFELVAAGVNKGNTLKLLAQRYGITLEECAAVGDSDNDLGMLRVVGLPIAMGNAAPQVKAVCRYESLSNAEDGVAAAIEYVLRCNKE